MSTQVEGGRERMELVRWGRFALDVEIAVAGTVVLLTVLTVAQDDGVGDFTQACQLVLGPLVATFAAHLFAAVLAAINQDRTPPSARRLGALTVHAAQYLLLAVPPLLVVGIVAVTGFRGREGPDEAITLVVDLGLVLLVALGGIGGWRALPRWWAALLGATAAFVLTIIVVVLRVILEH